MVSDSIRSSGTSAVECESAGERVAARVSCADETAAASVFIDAVMRLMAKLEGFKRTASHAGCKQ